MIDLHGVPMPFTFRRGYERAREDTATSAQSYTEDQRTNRAPGDASPPREVADERIDGVADVVLESRVPADGSRPRGGTQAPALAVVTRDGRIVAVGVRPAWVEPYWPEVK